MGDHLFQRVNFEQFPAFHSKRPAGGEIIAVNFNPGLGQLQFGARQFTRQHLAVHDGQNRIELAKLNVNVRQVMFVDVKKNILTIRP